MNGVLQDVRYALRQLRKSPGFAAVVVITLAVGIGANSAIFSVIEAVMLRPLPYKDPKQLMLLADSQDPENGGLLLKDINSLRSQSRRFSNIAFYYRDSGFSNVTLSAGTEPELVQGAFVSSNFFPVMGVAPALGRVFAPDEESRREHVVILSHALWIRRFGASRDAIGKDLPIGGVKYRVVGVMPATFEFPAPDQQFWAPVTTNRYCDDPSLMKIDASHSRYAYERWQAIGRLTNNTSFIEAQAEMNTIFPRLSQADPDQNRGPGITVTPLRVVLSGNTRLALIVLFCAVFFVLLISCSNVANLALARAASREREIAVRTALGAARVRLARQLLTESVVVALFSGVLGLVLASMGLRILIAFAPPGIPRIEEARLDLGVFAFALAISLLAAVAFGFAPTWKVSRKDPSDSLKNGGGLRARSAVRIRAALVAIVFALAVAVVAGAGLLVRSFLAL